MLPTQHQSFSMAIDITKDYINTGIIVIHQRETPLDTLLSLMASIKSRKKIFDVALAASLKDNEILGIYTAYNKDFEIVPFLEVIISML